eukprot:CAMPEP_0180698032 /NCGR_PEP_ID=MMETSP1038_2-20121128/3811_1 /TAXON_ID=632150 /ORGANISM="Azadinium spinosum, Strain 3D9" /LENGTH=179 /DNA_ID=CAMNT_0022729581 /DNA_START=27 /DNA_END=567 /DNA_ORIENTATION=-
MSYWKGAKSHAKPSLTHQDLRRHDEDWELLDENKKSALRAKLVGRMDAGPYIDRAKFSASECSRMLLSKKLEFAWTLEYSPVYWCDLVYEGIVPIGCECFNGSEPIQILLLACELRWSVLDFPKTHVSRQVRKKAKQYTMTVDTAMSFSVVFASTGGMAVQGLPMVVADVVQETGSVLR